MTDDLQQVSVLTASLQQANSEDQASASPFEPLPLDPARLEAVRQYDRDYQPWDGPPATVHSGCTCGRYPGHRFLCEECLGIGALLAGREDERRVWLGQVIRWLRLLLDEWELLRAAEPEAPMLMALVHQQRGRGSLV